MGYCHAAETQHHLRAERIGQAQERRVAADQLRSEPRDAATGRRDRLVFDPEGIEERAGDVFFS